MPPTLLSVRAGHTKKESKIMAKQLNKNLIVALTIAAFGVILALSVVMLQRIERSDPKYFVELAERTAKEGQWQQAAIFYNRAWGLSNDAKYLVFVGDMLLEGGEVGRALGSWEQALVHQPGLLDAHKRLIDVRMELGELYRDANNWENVHEATLAMLAVDTERSPQQEAFARDANGLALIALRRRAEDNAAKGLLELEKAFELAPEVVKYGIDLAMEYARISRFDEAESLLRKLVAENTAPGLSASSARLSLARFLARQQKFDEAGPLFSESVAFAGEDEDARIDAEIGNAVFLSVRWARARRDKLPEEEAQPYFDEAEKILTDQVARDPDNFKAYRQLALLYKASSRLQDVIDICEKRLARGLVRKGVKATQNRVDTFMLMLNASEAAVVLGLRAGDEGDSKTRDDFLSKAEQYVVDARGEAPTHPAVLSQAGRVKLARGQDRAAIEDLTAAHDAYKNFGAINWENTMILANTHLRLNEAGVARLLLENVLEEAARVRSNDPTFWTLYAQSLLQTGDLDRALRVADRVLVINPDSKDAALLKAAVYERQGKHAQAGMIQKQVTGSPTIDAMLRARAKSLEGDNKGAIDLLVEAIKADPTNPRLVGMTVHELVSADRQNEALTIAKRAVELEPQNAALQQVLVYAQPSLSETERNAAMLAAIDSEEDAYKRALDRLMFFTRIEDHKNALVAIDNALGHVRAKDTPHARNATATQHQVLLKTKIRIAAQLDDKVAMDSARDEGAEYNVDGAGGKTVLGLYYLQRRDFELAANAFREVISAQPTDASSLALLGQCLQMLGRDDEAWTAYERAIRANRDEGLAHLGLAVLAQQKDDALTFDRELDECERTVPNDPWVREQLIVRTEEADPQQAIVRRESILQKNPDDKYNLQRLASLYEKSGDQEKADAQHARLVELAPDDQRIATLAARYYRRTGRSDRAVDLLNTFAEAQTTDEDKVNALRLVAAELINQGKNDAAEKTLLDAIALHETFELQRALADFYVRVASDPEKALPWLDKAIARAKQDSPDAIPSLLESRVICRLHRKLNDTDGAREDVEELLRSHKDFVRGLLWQSEVFARTGEIDRAVDSLSAYLAKRPEDTYALYSRAQHYVARGNVALAIDDLKRIKRTSPRALRLEPRIMLARLQRHSGHEDLWIRELEDLHSEVPSSNAAAIALAEAYIQQQQYDDADRLVTAQMNQVGPAGASQWLFLRGRISLRLERPDNALRDFRQAAQADNFGATTVASVLGMYDQLGRYAEGVQYYQSLPESSKQGAIAKARYAKLLAGAGKRDRAVVEIREAMALATNQPLSVVRAVVNDLYQAFDRANAVELFESTSPSASTERANKRLLVRLHARDGDSARAIELLDQLLASASTDVERATLLHEKGDVLDGAGDAAGAVAAYEGSLNYDSKNWATLNNIAFLLSDKLNNHDGALQYAQRAVAIADNSFTLDTLGWTYVGLGRFDLAIAELSRAVRVNPDYGWAYFHLGEAYRRSGSFSQGSDVLRTGLDVAQTSDDVDLKAAIAKSVERVQSRDRTP